MSDPHKLVPCPECGLPMDERSNVCRDCFDSAQEATRVLCSECGKPIDPRARVCRDCYLAAQEAGRIVRPLCPDCGQPMDPTATLCIRCYRASLPGDNGPFPLSGRETALFGVIVSFENAQGQTFVCHRKGPTTKATREACAIALRHDESFRVVAISNPTSIYTDLQGSRLKPHNDDDLNRSTHTLTSEAGLLTKAGMRPMLHPRLEA